MKIAELSRVSGTHRSTIHHYLDLGLLPRPETLGPRLHHFGDEHVARLREIKGLRAQGLGLAEIRERLATRQRPRTPARRPRRRREGAEDRRAAILDAAARLFLERGFEGADVQAIARAAGVGKATVYQHFASKRELFVECLDRLRLSLVPATTRAQLAARQTPLIDEGRMRAQAVLSRFAGYRTLTNLLGAAAQGRDAEVAARAREALHRMVMNAEPSLRRAIAAGELRRGDSELWAYMLWGALLALGDRLALDGRYAQAEALTAYVDFMHHATAP
ncbi:TetR family transcriptional regulator [Nannocystis bainbridge]|uniref:TetR family transcriptional regulator n=1 Tax=Nannocystis bainbridge TaxID=2995303 RepID=A0ABT5E6I4_9BACT|nr:TetR family transcriptional regulator [Nannocystis bainbridge]MDC0720376.1 TetR family transcriptional regulator [Nannocystis bainbridge]